MVSGRRDVSCFNKQSREGRITSKSKIRELCSNIMLIKNVTW